MSSAQPNFNCFITVDKDADPADGTIFEGLLLTNNNAVFRNFKISDPGLTVELAFESFGLIVTLTETVPEGWNLADIVCENEDNVIVGPFDNGGRTIECVENPSGRSSIDCTLVNTTDCKVTVEKTADPAEDTLFSFTAPGSNKPEFTLNDPGNRFANVIVPIGENVTITEEFTQQWTLDDVECEESPGIAITDTENGVNAECLELGASTTCNFINVPAPRPIPALSEWGLIAISAILALAGILALRRRKAEV